MNSYKPRILDAMLQKKRQGNGAVLIKGPEWCGKITTGEVQALADQIDSTKMKSPAFKMILTAAGDCAYRRPKDGVYVVPIGCFGP